MRLGAIDGGAFGRRATAEANLHKLGGACDALQRAERRGGVELADDAAGILASQRQRRDVAAAGISPLKSEAMDGDGGCTGVDGDCMAGLLAAPTAHATGGTSDLPSCDCRSF